LPTNLGYCMGASPAGAAWLITVNKGMPTPSVSLPPAGLVEGEQRVRICAQA
jgi:hypothetical protein